MASEWQDDDEGKMEIKLLDVIVGWLASWRWSSASAMNGRSAKEAIGSGKERIGETSGGVSRC